MSSRRSSEDINAETLSVFEHTTHPNEPLTSLEVADALDCPRRTAYKRLQHLADLDAIRTKKVSSSGRVWWRPPPPSPDDTPTPSGSDHSEQHLDDVQATTSRSQRFVEQNRVGICIIQDGVVKYVNPTFTEMLGYTPDEALEEPILDFVAEDERDRVAEHVRQREHGEIDVIRYEGRGKHADGTAVDVEIHGDLIEYEGAPAILGTLVDMSERKEREHELEDYRTAVENVRDGVYMTDADRRFTMVNEAYCELTGYAREELLGAPVSHVIDEEERSQSAALIRELRAGERAVATTETHHYTPDGERIPVENRFTIRPDDDGTFQGTTGVVRDITDRLENERELREQRDRYRYLLETSPVPIVIYTADGTIAYVNEAATDRFAVGAADDLLGEAAIKFVHPDDRPESVERMRRVLEERDAAPTKDLRLIDVDGQLRHTILTTTPIVYEGQPAAQVVINDITERKQRERELEQYERIVETVDDGVYVVDDEGCFTMANEAYTNMVDYEREALVGEHVSLVVDETTATTAQGLEQKMKVGEREKPTVEADLQRADGGTITAEATFSLLPSDDSHERVGVVRNITERKEQEHQLDRQRQELAALNHLQAVALNISDLVLDQSTQIEMEQRVCERLAASNVYDFAWIGHTSRSGRELTAQAVAGADHLADTIVSLNETDPPEQSPIAQAVTTQSVQFARATFNDPVYERWCENTAVRDHSVIAVPIAYDGRRYGVVTLYTERSPPIGDTEQAILRQLGEIVGHAITALERNKSLLAERGIEVEYHSPALAESLVATAGADFELSLDRSIPVDTDEFLHYYTLNGLTAEQCIELVDEFPSVTDARVLVADGDSVRVAVRTTGETMASLFATFDGRIITIEITNGELRIVGELPETTNVRTVTEAMTEIHPDMAFAGQRYVMRQQLPSGQFRTVIEDSLTDRQRTVLEAACYSGFFDWPRKSSGGDVADSLDISSSTFHQHLRKAQKKLLDEVFVPA